jgi:transmembrane sensor
MSASNENGTQNASTAMTVEDIAADWSALRRMSENWSPERQAELDAWLTQSLAHRIAYLRIEATWRRTDRLAALRQPMQETADHGVDRKTLWLRTAAAIGFVILVGVVAGNYFVRPYGQLIETPKGGQERLTLSDGSRVELNTDTAIRINFDNRTRAIELVRGEAFFQIRHNTARSFVVTAAGHRIVDLGTQFLVRMGPESLRVALLEGRARLESARSRQHAVVLSPGDIAVATEDITRVSKTSERELSENLAWRRGVIIFRNERLDEAAVEFNRYGGPQLIVADADAAKLRVNGTFLTTGGEDFATVAREIFGLHVEHRNESIVLSR